jgi:hypothetical protein
MDIYQLVYSRLHRPRDAITFASLSKGTRHVMQHATQRWTVTVTEKTWDAGIIEWIRTYRDKVGAVTFRRWVCELDHTVDTVSYLYCHVFPHMLVNGITKSLTIHQLVPSSQRPDLGFLNAFPTLERLSITFSKEWGIVTIRPVELPRLVRVEFRAPYGTIRYDGFAATDLTIHANDIIVSSRVPETCTTLSVRASESFVYPEEFVPSGITTFDLVTKGVVSFERSWTSLEKFTCRCDSFIFDDVPVSLKHLDITVTLGFVYTDDAVNQAKKIPYCKVCSDHSCFG